MTKGYGEILKKSREAKDLTYVEIQKILKMDPSYLKAMENEDMTLFEKPVYMRFFLKTYSRMLKADTAEIMRLFDFSAEVQEAEKKKEKPRDKMLVGDMIKETEAKELEAAKGLDLSIINQKNMVIIGGAIGVLLLVILIFIFVYRGKGSTTTQGQAGNIYVATVSAPSALKVVVRAKEDVWMKARYDGTEDDFLLKKGEEKKWKDIQRVVFLVGNAGGVEFNVNGDAIGVIGEPGEVINGLVFETGKNWYIDKAQGFKRENPKPAMAEATAIPASAPAASTTTSKTE